LSGQHAIDLSFDKSLYLFEEKLKELAIRGDINSDMVKIALTTKFVQPLSIEWRIDERSDGLQPPSLSMYLTS
jgi:hypothetical protein